MRVCHEINQQLDCQHLEGARSRPGHHDGRVRGGGRIGERGVPMVAPAFAVDHLEDGAVRGVFTGHFFSPLPPRPTGFRSQGEKIGERHTL